MRTPVVIALLLVAPVLAGCLDASNATVDEGEELNPLTLDEIEDALTQPVYADVERFEDVVEGHGGKAIWVDVYRPGDADVPVPVILVKTPYQAGGSGAPGSCGDDVRPESCPYMPWLVDYFVPRGYAVAFADVRGNHNSGGCIEQTGPPQWEDGYNVVEWLGAQDWSNGRVGMYGASYDGESQIGTALLNPPSLKTIVPTASVSNQYEYSFYDGAPYTTGPLGTNVFYFALSLAPGTHPNAVLTYPERFECVPENFQAALDWSGDWSTYWEERDYRPGASAIEASVLQTHGLQDWNVKPNHVDGFWNELTSEKRLVLGQWGHAFPQREDWTLILHRWFDHYLHGIDTGVLEDLPPVLVEDTDGKWRGIGSFPPVDAARMTLWPGADGSLASTEPETGEVTIRDYPRSAPGATWVTAVTDPNVLDPASDAGAVPPARVIFESEPLTEDLHYTGRPVVHLVADTDAERTHWAVNLYAVSPSGDAEWLNSGYLNTRHANGVKEDPVTLTPGETYEAAIRLFPQDDVIPEGHRVRVVVSNADDRIQQADTYATSTIHLGLEGTRVTFPVAPEGVPVGADALRPELSE